MSLTDQKHWPSIKRFYDERDGERSVESDFGVWWRTRHNFHRRWRISLVVDTGDIYAIRTNGPSPDGPAVIALGDGLPPLPNAAVVLLGTGYTRDSAEQALNGWPEMCGQEGSLEWAIRRLRVREE